MADGRDDLDLRDCPFCGSAAYFNDTETEIHCVDCGATIAERKLLGGPGLKRLIAEKWNKRTPQTFEVD